MNPGRFVESRSVGSLLAAGFGLAFLVSAACLDGVVPGAGPNADGTPIVTLFAPSFAVNVVSPSPTSLPATPTSVGPAAIWRPALVTSWQWQLTGLPVDLSVDAQVFDIDLFDNDAAVVQALKAKGRRVVCYVNAGAWEGWRPDSLVFPDAVKGQELDGYPDERWLDVRDLAVLGPIMEARVRLCRSKGFDAVEFDNVDGYSNRSGFPLTAKDQLVYNRFLANTAHAQGLSAALKNDLDQVGDLVNDFDFALNEQCFEYKECDSLLPFIKAGKAVFHVEYSLATGAFCQQANALNFNSLRKRLALDSYREACR